MPEAYSSHRLIRILLTWLLPAAGLGFVLHRIVAQARAGGLDGLQLNGAWLCITGLLLILCFLFIQLNGWVLLRGLNDRFDLLSYSRIWFVSNMGKYIPGKVLLLASRAGLMEAAGVRPLQSVTLLFSEIGLLLLSAGTWFAGMWLWHRGWRLGVCAGLLMPSLLVSFCAGVFNWMLRRALRLFKKQEAAFALSRRVLLESSLCALVAWGCYGASGWTLARALDAGLSIATLPQFLGALPVAWAAGFLVLLAPGGLGVRETCITLLLAPAIPQVLASATSLVLRLGWLTVELCGYVWAVWLTARADRPAATEGT